MITTELYLEIRGILADRGHGDDYTWSQSVKSPPTPEALACEYAWVVLNSGMRSAVARKIMDRVWPLVTADEPIGSAFKHKGKAAAIQEAWRRRVERFDEFFGEYLRDGGDVLAWCQSLPWIGGITKYHLAKNLGVDCAKPDRWLVRLAGAEGETVDGLCGRLAAETGDRVATVDVVLWRACAIGLLKVRDGAVVVAYGAV